MEINILDILDAVFKDITKKVTKIDMYNVELATLDEKSNSLIISTFGDYKMTFVFCASTSVVKAITESMKRGKVLDTIEMELYAKEYFNILCGRIVTIINNSTRKSAKFTVPNIIDGIYLHNITPKNLNTKELFYNSNYGVVKMQAIYS